MTQAVVFENTDEEDFQKACYRLFPLNKTPEVVGSSTFNFVEQLNLLHKGKVIDAEVYEAKGYSEYHFLRAFIYVGKTESATGLGTRSAVVQCDTEYASKNNPANSFVTPETLFVVQSPLIFYKGDFNDKDGLDAQERALDLANKAADDAIAQYLDSGNVATED